METGHHRTSGRSALDIQIHGCVGRGGFGEVYHATMTTSAGVARQVAIKTLRADIDPGSDAVKRLRDEGRLLGAVHHPAIVGVHDLVLLDGRVALVTEFVEGQDLLKMRTDRIGLRALIEIIGEVASALDTVWSSPGPDRKTPLHLVHRDVKPGNIRIGHHGEVKLLDFGIARANVEREAHTQTNMAMGSLTFMSPERFQSQSVDPPSDIYALGCTLYFGIMGHGLFPDQGQQVVWNTMLRPKRCREHLDNALSALPPDLPADLRMLLVQMMAPDPGDRPNAADVTRICEDLEETLPGPSLKRWCQTREWPEPGLLRGSIVPGKRSLPTWEGQRKRLESEPTMAPTPAPVPRARGKVLDGEAIFGINDLTDAEFEAQLQGRGGAFWLKLLLLSAVLAAVAGAGVAWQYPEAAQQWFDLALTSW